MYANITKIPISQFVLKDETIHIHRISLWHEFILFECASMNFLIASQNRSDSSPNNVIANDIFEYFAFSSKQKWKSKIRTEDFNQQKSDFKSTQMMEK